MLYLSNTSKIKAVLEERGLHPNNFGQTDYGALDCISGELFWSSCSTANSASTIEFVKQIQAQDRGAKLVVLWDGASYHRSQEFRDFLTQVNQGDDWRIHCL